MMGSTREIVSALAGRGIRRHHTSKPRPALYASSVSIAPNIAQTRKVAADWQP